MVEIVEATSIIGEARLPVTFSPLVWRVPVFLGVDGYSGSKAAGHPQATEFTGDSAMEHARYLDPSTREDTAPALQALADYLELALDDGESFALLRLGANACQVLIGEPDGELDDMTCKGTIPAGLADEMLALTQDGTNVISVDGQRYRFTRFESLIDNWAKVVFTPS